MRPALRAFPLLLAATLQAGCGKGDEAPPPPPGMAEALEELAEVYRYMAQERKSPPRKLADLEPYQESLQHSWPRIERGEIVVLWEVGLGRGRGPLAYESGAPSEGGMVLLRDGTVRTMTAAEFKAAR